MNTDQAVHQRLEDDALVLNSLCDQIKHSATSLSYLTDGDDAHIILSAVERIRGER